MVEKHRLDTEHVPSSLRRPAKRQRLGGRVQLFNLSDELLLRTLSYLSIDALTRCERVCHKFRGLATDNEIWREKYFDQFVQPRARRVPVIPSKRTEEQKAEAVRLSSKNARCLGYSRRMRTGPDTDWKHEYKIKFNWTRGRARRSEVHIDSSPVPAVLAHVHAGKLFTADSQHGLRVWKSGSILHTLPLRDDQHPTSLFIESDGGQVSIAVGFDQGVVSVISFDGKTLAEKATALGKSNTSITSVALAWPYLLTMAKSRCIELFQCATDGREQKSATSLADLHSDADLSPASLTLRKTKTTLVAGIAYAFNRFNTGWCLGLQEIRMNFAGTITDNRTTSSIHTPLVESFKRDQRPQFTSRSASTTPFSLHPELMRAPNSLSYCGCYILAGLPDNTLMVYTVTSTVDKLEINVGRRLWGHTSAVSAAEVTSTGKALSISANSEEMRYWELEELLSSFSHQKTSTTIHPLSKLDGAIRIRRDGVGLALKEVKHEFQLLGKRVSFDDEQAIVVGERDRRQIISCFDFA